MSVEDLLLAVSSKDRSWMDQASCKGMPVSIFYPEKDAGSKTKTNQAKQVCKNCPVKQECLEYGIAEVYGTWGGLAPRKRQKARTQVKGAS